MANKENQKPSHTPPMISSISPSNKPALNRQRDHSACRRPETPLKVRKTRENLKQLSIFADIPPPCMHLQHGFEHDASPCVEQTSDVSVNTKLESFNKDNEYDRTLYSQNGESPSVTSSQTQSLFTEVFPKRQRSVSRRMLSRVKQGIASRSKAAHQSIRPAESETSLVRRLSGLRKQSAEGCRAQSFEISRDSVDSSIDDHLESIGTRSSVARSFSESTVSTAEVLRTVSMNDTVYTPPSTQFGERMIPAVLPINISSPSAPAYPASQSTPKPPKKDLPALPNEIPTAVSATIPCVDLDVALDCGMLDVHTSREIWVAIKATVRGNTTIIDTSMAIDGRVHMPTYELQAHCKIKTLRLCFKPAEGCRIRNIVGRKTMGNLTIGQECSLFIRVHVPKILFKETQLDLDQESLFAEVESIVGTLETEILHVEARYRHSMLPSDNVVTVRHVCQLKRPKIESRWSIASSTVINNPSCDAQKRLSKYLAVEFPAAQALQLIQQYLHPELHKDADVSEIMSSLTSEKQLQQIDNWDEANPSVVVTDIDWNAGSSSIQMQEHFSTAPSTPATAIIPFEPPQSVTQSKHKRQTSSTSSLSSKTRAPPLISAPKTTTALSITASQLMSSVTSDVHDSLCPEDSARKLWRHIRHSSLSSKQMEELNTPDGLQHLESGDEALKELRRKALANKRSVGAETLKGWKWDEKVLGHERIGEAPWM